MSRSCKINQRSNALTFLMLNLLHGLQQVFNPSIISLISQNMPTCAMNSGFTVVATSKLLNTKQQFKGVLRCCFSKWEKDV